MKKVLLLSVTLLFLILGKINAQDHFLPVAGSDPTHEFADENGYVWYYVGNNSTANSKGGYVYTSSSDANQILGLAAFSFGNKSQKWRFEEVPAAQQDGNFKYKMIDQHGRTLYAYYDNASNRKFITLKDGETSSRTSVQLAIFNLKQSTVTSPGLSFGFKFTYSGATTTYYINHPGTYSQPSCTTNASAAGTSLFLVVAEPESLLPDEDAFFYFTFNTGKALDDNGEGTYLYAADKENGKDSQRWKMLTTETANRFQFTNAAYPTHKLYLANGSAAFGERRYVAAEEPVDGTAEDLHQITLPTAAPNVPEKALVQLKVDRSGYQMSESTSNNIIDQTSGNAAKARITFIKDKERRILATNSSLLDFGAKANGNTAEALSVQITGINLSDAISHSLSNADGTFIVEEGSDWDNQTGGTLHISFNPQTTRSYKETLTIASDGIKSLEITLTGKSYEPHFLPEIGAHPEHPYADENGYVWYYISNHDRTNQSYSIVDDKAMGCGAFQFRNENRRWRFEEFPLEEQDGEFKYKLIAYGEKTLCHFKEGSNNKFKAFADPSAEVPVRFKISQHTSLSPGLNLSFKPGNTGSEVFMSTPSSSYSEVVSENTQHSRSAHFLVVAQPENIMPETGKYFHIMSITTGGVVEDNGTGDEVDENAWIGLKTEILPTDALNKKQLWKMIDGGTTENRFQFENAEYTTHKIYLLGNADNTLRRFIAASAPIREYDDEYEFRLPKAPNIADKPVFNLKVERTDPLISVSADNFLNQSESSNLFALVKALEPALEASTNTVAFGIKEVNVTSAPMSVTITGKEIVADIAYQLSAGAENFFTVTPASGWNNRTGGALNITFKPAEEKEYTATLTISSDGATSQEIAISGTGVLIARDVIASTTKLEFEETEINTISAILSVDVSGTNLQNDITYAVSEDVKDIFIVTTGENWNNATGGTLNVTFNPIEAKDYAGTLTLSSAGANAATVALTGKGFELIKELQVSRNTIPFTKTVIGATSDALSVTVTGSNLIEAISYELSAGIEDIFTVTLDEEWNTTTGGIMNVTFSPAEAKAYSGTLTIKSDGAVSKEIVLSGTGYEIHFLPVIGQDATHPHADKNGHVWYYVGNKYRDDSKVYQSNGEEVTMGVSVFNFGNENQKWRFEEVVDPLQDGNYKYKMIDTEGRTLCVFRENDSNRKFRTMAEPTATYPTAVFAFSQHSISAPALNMTFKYDNTVYYLNHPGDYSQPASEKSESTKTAIYLVMAQPESIMPESNTWFNIALNSGKVLEDNGEGIALKTEDADNTNASQVWKMVATGTDKRYQFVNGEYTSHNIYLVAPAGTEVADRRYEATDTPTDGVQDIFQITLPKAPNVADRPVVEMNVDRSGYKVAEQADNFVNEMSGGTKASFITFIKTTNSLAKEITVDNDNVPFETTEINTTSEIISIVVTGNNLTEAITYELSANSDIFTVTTGTDWNTTTGGTLNITFTPTEVKEYNATLTLASEGAISQSVTISGRGKVQFPFVVSDDNNETWYYLKSLRAGGKVFEARGSEAGYNVAAMTPDPVTKDAQLWKFVANGESYQIVSKTGAYITSGNNIQATTDAANSMLIDIHPATDDIFGQAWMIFDNVNNEYIYQNTTAEANIFEFKPTSSSTDKGRLIHALTVSEMEEELNTVYPKTSTESEDNWYRIKQGDNVIAIDEDGKLVAVENNTGSISKQIWKFIPKRYTYQGTEFLSYQIVSRDEKEIVINGDNIELVSSGEVAENQLTHVMLNLASEDQPAWQFMPYMLAEGFIRGYMTINGSEVVKAVNPDNVINNAANTFSLEVYTPSPDNVPQFTAGNIIVITNDKVLSVIGENISSVTIYTIDGQKLCSSVSNFTFNMPYTGCYLVSVGYENGTSEIVKAIVK